MTCQLMLYWVNCRVDIPMRRRPTGLKVMLDGRNKSIPNFHPRDSLVKKQGLSVLDRIVYNKQRDTAPHDRTKKSHCIAIDGCGSITNAITGAKMNSRRLK